MKVDGSGTVGIVGNVVVFWLVDVIPKNLVVVGQFWQLWFC